MGNRLKGEIEFKSGAETYVLRFGMNELIELQEAYGIDDEDMDALMPKLAAKMDALKGRRKAVFIALKANHPEITEQQVGDLVSDVGFQQMGKLILDALRWALPEKKKEAEGSPAGKGDDVLPGMTFS